MERCQLNIASLGTPNITQKICSKSGPYIVIWYWRRWQQAVPGFWYMSRTLKIHEIVLNSCEPYNQWQVPYRSTFALTVHIKDASVSTSFTLVSRKCFSAMAASTWLNSRTSVRIGVRFLYSSSSNRELRRRLCSFDSRRGRFAGVTLVRGVGAREPHRLGSWR